jgi:hypothetical protein
MSLDVAVAFGMLRRQGRLVPTQSPIDLSTTKCSHKTAHQTRHSDTTLKLPPIGLSNNHLHSAPKAVQALNKNDRHDPHKRQTIHQHSIAPQARHTSHSSCIHLEHMKAHPIHQSRENPLPITSSCFSTLRHPAPRPLIPSGSIPRPTI